MFNTYTNTLNDLKVELAYRSLKPQSYEGMVNLCSNDYLGLTSDPLLYQNFLAQLTESPIPFGSTSSRLLSGNATEHTLLEESIAKAFGREDCLLYNSGYHANMGILPTLAGKADLIIADKLVHASIIDGIRLSQAKAIRFRHLDYEHLERILVKESGQYERIFIVSESIFSMDGDVADLQKLVELKQRFNVLLYIDEAHAFGARGTNGLGCVEEQDVIPHVDFIVGTFGKALASVGAYVVCDSLFREYLINFSRTLIFTTALPPVNIAWTHFLFQKLPTFQHQRKQLVALSQQLAQQLGTTAHSHIIPFIVGANDVAVNLSTSLHKNGFNVLPIRHPAVPIGTARLRFSVNAGLSATELLPLKKNLLKHHE